MEPTRVLLLSQFGLFGILVGAQGVLWAEIVPALRLSEGAFGSAQLTSPLVSVVILLMGGSLAGPGGKRPLALASLTLLAGAALLLASAKSLPGLLGALGLAGAGTGLLEVAINGATLDWERTTGRPAMNLMHAAFSGSAVLGAFAAGALLELGRSYAEVLGLLAGLCGLAVVGTWSVRYPPAAAGEAVAEGVVGRLRLFLSRRVLVVLALLAVLGLVGESVANTWSVIYLRGLGAQALVGGAAFALFNGAMFIGRLANARLVARLGPRVSLVASGVGIAVSAGLLLAPGGVSSAVAAFVVLGLASAGIVPTVLSTAAEVAPGQSGAIAGGMLAAAYGSFIVCPPVVGWLAELISLKMALLSVGVSGLGVVWLARGVRGV